jgi:hypothetical protein
VNFDILRPLILGGALGLAAYSLTQILFSLRRPGGRLTQFAKPETTRTTGDTGSTKHKIRLVFSSFGLDVAGNEQLARLLAWLGLGTVLALILILVQAPLLMAPAAFVAAWFLMETQFNGAWVKLVQGMEKEIPIFLSRLASTVQIESNVLEAMNEVAETLDAKGPLRDWMLKFIGRCQAGGLQALTEMQAEAQAISTSLGIVVFEIGRLWETGGPGYVRAFAMAADNIADALQARALAHAKGAGAKGSIQAILFALIAVMVMLFTTPQFSSAMQDPTIQIAYALILGWMFFGWSLIDSLITGAI